MNTILLVVALIAFIIYTFYCAYSNVVYSYTMESVNVDGESYFVRNTGNKQEAVRVLAEINKKMKYLVEYMYEHKDDYPLPINIEMMYQRFLKRPTVLSEGHLNDDYTSYTVNKGEEIVFCLRPRDNDKLVYDLNTITFVALHELSHVASLTTGHNDEFKKNFTMILREAMRLNLYRYQDYSKYPVDYCGMVLNSSVL